MTSHLTDDDRAEIVDLVVASVAAAVTAAGRTGQPAVVVMDGVINDVNGNTVDVEPLAQPGETITATCTDPDMAIGDRTILHFYPGGVIHAIGRVPGGVPPL